MTILTSGQISDSIGAQNQMLMSGMAMGQMSGGLPGYPNIYGPTAENIAGKGIGLAASIGAPAAMLGMSLAGLDPISMGMKGAMRGFAAGGLSGGAMGAIGAAAIPFAATAIAGYGMHQVMTGVGQQQQLNQTLRSSFNFIRQQGQGFTKGEMGQIGSMMRHMTHQFGPTGEITGMEELTNLAGKMGQMGLMRNVQGMQEFSRKFKETVEQVKVIAREMNTTLEAALEFTKSMQQSGVFQKQDQIKFALQARKVALGTGLSVSESTGAANMGSQISRMFGGTGKQGTFAGIRTMNDIGTALQTGVITDEDIYNATGQTGQEGRQALAINMLQHSGRFMKSGRGRYFLASIAGKDGTIDESAAMEYMMGGVGVGRTRQLAGENLGGVGRANFIRNEGRLRGAAMERFGGLMQSMAYKGWLGERGWDPGSMRQGGNDYGMLAFQRFSGLGRDEAETALKMVEQLPELINTQDQKAKDAAYLQQAGERWKTTGIRGLKVRFEQEKEKLNTGMQAFGQKLFAWGTEYIESFFNKQMSTFVTRASEEAMQTYRNSMMSGSAGAGLFKTTFGSSASMMRNRGALGAMTSQGTTWDSFNAETGGMGSSIGGYAAKGAGIGAVLGLGILSPVTAAIGGVLGGAYGAVRGVLGHDESYRKQYEKAGFDFDEIANLPEGSRDQALRDKLKQLSSVQSAADFMDSGSYELGKSNRSLITEIYGQGAASFGGQKRIDAVTEQLRESARRGNKGADAMIARLDKASTPEERAAIIGSIEKGAAITEEARLGNMMKGLPKGLGGAVMGGASSEQKYYAKLSDGMLDGESYFTEPKSAGFMDKISAHASYVWDGSSTSASANWQYGETARAATGKFLQSSEGLEMMAGLAEGKGPGYEAAMKRMTELRAQESKGSLGDNSGIMEVLGRGAAGGEYQRIMDDPFLAQEEKDSRVRSLVDRVSKERGKTVTADMLKSWGKLGAAKMVAAQVQNTLDVMGKVGAEAAEFRDAALRTGMAVEDRSYAGADTDRVKKMGYTIATERGLFLSDEAKKGLSKEGVASVEAFMAYQEKAAGMVDASRFTGTNEEQLIQRMRAFEESSALGRASVDTIADLSTEEKRKVAAQYAGTSADSMAKIYASMYSQDKRFSGAVKGKKGKIGAVADFMGFDISDDQAKNLNQALQAGKFEDIMGLASKELGITFNEEQQVQFKKALEQAKSGKGTAGSQLGALMSTMTTTQRADIKQREETKQDDAAKARDPSFRMLQKISATMDRQLAALSSLPTDIAAAQGITSSGGSE